SEKNGLFHFGIWIHSTCSARSGQAFDFRSLQLQRKSRSAHFCQKRVPAVKSIPVVRVISPSALRGAERNVVLSKRNELGHPSSNFLCTKRPPTHSDSASWIQFRGNSDRASIVTLTVTFRSLFSMSAHTK